MGNKNKDVAESPLEAPPAAAYPDSPSSYPDSSGNSSAPSPAAPGNNYAATNSAPSSAPSAPSAPTFELRSGEQLITHSIKRGDTLGAIAKQYNSSQSRIMAANGMTSTKIIAGKTLQVPTSAPPTDLAMNGAGAGAAPGAASTTYPSTAALAPYSRTGSLYSSPSAPASSSPYSAPAPAPVTPPTSYGSGSYGSSTTGGSYPSPSSGAPAPPVAPAAPATQPSYSTSAPSPPVVPTAPSTTSFPRVQTAPAAPQPGGAFPTPNLSSGSGQVQFSN